MTFRYKLDANDYFTNIFDACSGDNCLLYTGECPEGFPYSVDIREYKLIDGIIVHDPNRAAELAEQKTDEENECGVVHKCDLNGLEKTANKVDYIGDFPTSEQYPSAVAVKNSHDTINNKIGDVENTVTILGDDVDYISTELTEIKMKQDNVEVDLTNGKNNLLKGTALYDLEQWGWGYARRCYEGETPPASPEDMDYWYCTKDNNGYINGYIYQYRDSEWVETALTRKDLETDNINRNLTIVENDFTKQNLLSGKMLKIEPTEEIPWGMTRTSHTNLNIQKEYMTLSMQIENHLEYGQLTINSLEFSKEQIYQQDITSIILGSNKFVLPDDYTDLSTIEIKIPIVTDKILVTGAASQTTPTDTTIVWLDLNGQRLKKYNTTTSAWEEITECKMFLDTTTGTYWYPTSLDGGVSWIYMVCADIENGINAFSTWTYMGIDGVTIETNWISETAPTPEKGMYWAKPSDDLIYRARYDGDTFAQWELIEVTYTEAVAHGQEYYASESPVVPPKGYVLIGDVKLEYGDRTDWCLNQNESYGVKYKLDDKGFEIKKGNNRMFMDEDEISAYYKEEEIFGIDEQEVFSKISRSVETDVSGLITKAVTIRNNKNIIRYIKD